jgi:hypothetical protein
MPPRLPVLDALGAGVPFSDIRRNEELRSRFRHQMIILCA